VSFVDYFNTTVTLISNWSVPMLIAAIPLYGMIKGVKVYEVFVDGAREGFDVAVRIMPYLVAILVAIGLFRDVTAMNLLIKYLEPFTSIIGMPAEILPMAIIRPLSGSGASGVMNSIFITYGPDSFVGLMASVMMGCTETTLYVLAVYFGAVNIKKTRHALPAGIIGDIGGIAATLVFCHWAFGDLLQK
jgi:spore maturation protein B